MQHRRRKEAQETSRRKQGVLHLNRVHRDVGSRHFQSASLKGVCDPAAGVTFARRQTPALIDQFGKTDLSPACPRVAQSRNNDAAFMQQHLHGHIRGRRRTRQATDHEVDVMVAQMAILQLRGLVLDDMEREPRILSGQSIDNGGKQARHHRLGTSDAQFARRGIGQRLQFVHAASQIIAQRDTASEQCPAIKRGLDAKTTALQKREGLMFAPAPRSSWRSRAGKSRAVRPPWPCCRIGPRQ